MTPEERFDRIEAKLQFTAGLLQRTSLHHAGLRGLYRKGAHRIDEMAAQTAADFSRLAHRLDELADESDKHNGLLAALMESQMRTEKNLSRLEQTVASLADSVQKLVNRNGK